MADYSRDFQVEYGESGSSCTIWFRCFDVPNAVTIHGIDSLGIDTEELLLDVRRRCLDYHRLWSFSLEGSDIARLNTDCDRIAVDRRTVQVLAAMKEFNALEPSFDFTIGPVSYLWKHAEQLPSDEEIERALSHVGADKVAFDGDTVVKADPKTRIDVGGAAKGFVADDIAALLRAAGVESADVDLGGNLFMLGNHPKGRPWRVAVHIPQGVTAERPVIEVHDQSVVTSGSYERFVEIDGKRYQHIIDAATGRPSESDIVSATVVSESSLMADMLATCALMAGTEGLDALKTRHPHERFIVITAGGEILE